MMTEIAIQARGLTKEYGGRPVLRRLDLDVLAGQAVALTGANGAGKTTLLRCLATLTRPTAGEVRWFGQPATAHPALRRQVGMAAHEHRLYPHLSLRENLVFAARLCGVDKPQTRAEEWLERIGLTTSGHCLPAQASKGMRQRASVARALIHEPRILLLDEPFSGLDQASSRWLKGLLLDLRGAGRTICFASHDDRQTHVLADRVWELRSGELDEARQPADRPASDLHIWPRAA
jgi:heme exporter protein A